MRQNWTYRSAGLIAHTTLVILDIQVGKKRKAWDMLHKKKVSAN